MPKISSPGIPSSAGMTGHVVNARDEVYEVDPSRNVDGSRVDGYESDERDLKDDENYQSPAVGEPPVPTEDNPAYRQERDADPQHPSSNDGNAEDQRREHREQAEQAEQGAAGQNKKEVPSSPGNSSPASPQKTASTRQKR